LLPVRADPEFGNLGDESGAKVITNGLRNGNHAVALIEARNTVVNQAIGLCLVVLRGSQPRLLAATAFNVAFASFAESYGPDTYLGFEGSVCL